MPRGISKCPQCGEPVSAFAAGCAICGADLEAARARRAARRRLALPGPRHVRGAGHIDWIHLAIAAVLAVAAPPIGLLLSLYWAYQRRRVGEHLMAAAMIVIAALSVTALLAPVWFWSHILAI
jgi:hypothetical protein